MLVSFYVQISIILMSFLLVLLPFLGLPQSLDKALTAIFGSLIFGISVYALYRGYVRILKREEKRLEKYEVKEKKPREESVASIDEETRMDSHSERAEFKTRDHGALNIVRD